ncbi:MAG: HflK protein, partial [Pseudomonadota bacterium]
MRKFLELFSVNDPGWGNSHPGSGSKDAKGGQGSDQSPQAEPSNPDAEKPVEVQPNKQPAKSDGPPDLDELWRDFNDRLSGIFGGKKKPGATSSKPANKPNSTDIPPPSQRGNGGNNGGNGGGGMSAPNFN